MGEKYSEKNILASFFLSNGFSTDFEVQFIFRFDLIASEATFSASVARKLESPDFDFQG